VTEAPSPVTHPRASGVQLHVTSLPGGRLGEEARRFVDWLASAGQSVWQVLPVSVPDEHGSPYKSPSAFAASPALLEHPQAPVSRAELDAFATEQSYWVASWTAFGGDLADQVRFAREWTALRAYARERGVRLMGDVPIYVAPAGADERAWPQFFRTDAVAGVPPDAYAATGQLWGNPLYHWDALRDDGHRWWVERLRRTFALFDVVRLDHFRGFSAYWAVPQGAETALGGHWEPGPGRAPFDAARSALGSMPVLAEDLGDIDQSVIDLRDALGYPGMAVLQFAFEPAYADNTHDPHNQRPNQVVYTGTHDSDTIRGWYESITPAQHALVDASLGRHGIVDDPNWALIRLVFRSPAVIAMIQIQDALNLGKEGRMNQPGSVGAWGWRLDALPSADVAKRLRAATEEARRLPRA
jgi:4-alpha-glucanotransferase